MGIKKNREIEREREREREMEVEVKMGGYLLIQFHAQITHEHSFKGT
jgi:collagenase-like PrtC family protease